MKKFAKITAITALVLDVREGLKMDHNDSLADKFALIYNLCFHLSTMLLL